MFISHAAAAKSLQSCPTLCDPMDSSPPGSSVHWILQARILEWAAISFTLHGHDWLNHRPLVTELNLQLLSLPWGWVWDWKFPPPKHMVGSTENYKFTQILTFFNRGKEVRKTTVCLSSVSSPASPAPSLESPSVLLEEMPSYFRTHLHPLPLTPSFIPTLTNHYNNHLNHFILILLLLSVSSGLCPFLQ